MNTRRHLLAVLLTALLLTAGLALAQESAPNEGVKIIPSEPVEPDEAAGAPADPAAAQAGPSKVVIETGRVLINGQPITIYGTFRDPSDDWREFSGIVEAGFNLVHDYRFENPQTTKNLDAEVDKWIADAKEYLALAHKNGCGTFLGIPRILAGCNTISDLTHEQQAAYITKMVNAVKDEPALWFWYLADEPTGVALKLEKEMKYRELADYLAYFGNAYATIKKADPNHPVAIVDTDDRILEMPIFSAKYCDTIWPDIYGRAYSTLTTARWTEALRKKFNKPTLGVPHGGTGLAHIQGVIRRNKHDQHPVQMRMNDRTNENKPRYLRVYLHSLIAAGSPGLVFYWSPVYFHNVPKDTPGQWKALCDLGKEIKMLEPVFLSTEPVEGIEVEIDHWGAYNRAWELYGKETMTREEITALKPLMYWQRKHDGAIYMGFAADVVPTQRVTINLPFEIESVTVVNENLPILKRNAKDKLIPDQKRTPVAIWGYTDKSFSFLMNESDAVVLKFQPRYRD